MEKWIYYFCYGSNMLIQRMHINNKSATKFANGTLRNYRLSFAGYSTFWDGSSANIVPDSKSNVIGVVYKLAEEDIARLDKQEVGYDAIQVEVELEPTPDQPLSTTVTCRTYVQKPEYANAGEGIPSKLYKDIIVKGAEEHKLPQEYIDSVLKAFPDNGNTNCGPPGFVL